MRGCCPGLPIGLACLCPGTQSEARLGNGAKDLVPHDGVTGVEETRDELKRWHIIVWARDVDITFGPETGTSESSTHCGLPFLRLLRWADSAGTQGIHSGLCRQVPADRQADRPTYPLIDLHVARGQVVDHLKGAS